MHGLFTCLSTIIVYQVGLLSTLTINSGCFILFELYASLRTSSGAFHHRNMDNHVNLACFGPFNINGYEKGRSCCAARNKARDRYVVLDTSLLGQGL